MKPKHSPGLADKARANVFTILSHALEEELRLSSTTRDVYAKFPTFHSLHKLFADQYRQLEQWLDQLARRTGALGGTAGGTTPDLAPAAGLARPTAVPEQALIGELLSRHGELAKRLQNDVRTCSNQLGDAGTADILKRLVEFHETTAWMLRTVLAGSVSNPANRG